MNQFFTIQELTISNNNTSYQIDTINVRNISIYNSINQVGYILKLDINDIYDIKNKFPLKGAENVIFDVRDYYNNSFRKEFVLTDVVLLNEQNERDSLIQLSLVSKESFYLSINRDYNYYTSTLPNIIRTYLNENSTLTNLSPNTSTYNVLIPGFSRTKAITYMNDQFTDGFFFERMNDYLYSEINELVNQSTDNIKTYKFISNNSFNRELILDYQEQQVFNALDEGYYNNYKRRNLTYNPNSKNVETKDFSINNIQTNNFTLGSGENFSNLIQSDISTTIHRDIYYTNVLDETSTDRLFNKEYDLLTYGDLSVNVGDLVQINYKDRFNDNPNPLLNGLYLVTQTASHVDQKIFHNKIRISKNAYFKGTNNDSIVENVVF